MGNFVNHNLIKGEHIVFETKDHWIVFFSLKSLLTLFISPWIARYTDEYVITNKRVIIKRGWIRQQTLEMNLNKIESVQVDRTLGGRILGYGSIRLIGSGGTNEVFHNISQALEFRKQFQESLA
ncbi:MAG: PH domain-containing protein [Gammaproteobacteria bacterium]|nr:PH domain-containing protein [Gammaproteobacteria bacterium]